jgi:MFS family permease
VRVRHAAGVVLLVVFYLVELRTEVPLINVRIFRNQTFLVQNIILGIAMMAFIPVFFFASTYGQISLAEKATTASLLILYFFIGFVIAAQIGDRMLDRGGAKRPVVPGCVLAAVGFFEWAGEVTTLSSGSQVTWIVVAGAGMGLMLGQANTDAINRASRLSYGEATGVTQTVPNYGASLGFAILGTVLITQFRSNVTDSLVARACRARRRRRRRPPSPSCRAAAATSRRSHSSSGPTSPPRPRTCSTAWAWSWRWPPSWPSSVSGAACSRTSRPRPPPRRRRRPAPPGCPGNEGRLP